MDIRTEFTDLLTEIEDEMLSVLGTHDGAVRPLYEMLAYHLGLDDREGPRGKRIRPLLGLLAVQALGQDWRKALPGAAAVELGHNFSLVHDDIEDNDLERHHRPTLWAIWGVPLAINAGDALFALSRLALYRLVDADTDPAKVLRMMRVYDQTCLDLCEGQYLDISFERRLDVTVDEYMDMIGRKTASLIGGSLEAGATMGTDDLELVAAFRRFGDHLGMAFQVADDVKGSFWSSEELGKGEAGDIRHRKKTLPVIWALANAGAGDRARLAEIYQPAILATDGSLPPDVDRLVAPDEVREVLAIFERCGARDHCLGEARRLRDAALADVDGLPVEDDRRGVLRAFVETVIAV